MIKVFTNGVFDLFHEGHHSLLFKAKQEGDYLLVGIASDESCAQSKRPPLQSWSERADVIRKLSFVDEVVETPWSKDLTEDFYTQNAIAWQVQGDRGSSFALAKQLGILKVVGRTAGISTTKLINIIQSNDGEILEGGHLNDVKRVFFEDAYYVFKYSNRTVARKYPIDLPDHRTRDEYDVITEFHKYVKEPEFIVKPIFSDRNKIIVFESAPVQAESLFEKLLRQDVDEDLLIRIARSLASLHKSTRNNDLLRERFGKNDGFVKIKIDVQCRNATQDELLHPCINDFIDQSMEIKEVLLHGDFAPKNILVWDLNKYLFIDFEESGYGDPALDVGYFLAHLYLHQVISSSESGELLLVKLLKVYLSETGNNDPHFVERINKYIGIIIVSRMDSKAPAAYIPPQYFEQLRAVARPLIIDGDLLLRPGVASAGSDE
jgi:glycerol-3-phosphate cytidylyltransferase